MTLSALAASLLFERRSHAQSEPQQHSLARTIAGRRGSKEFRAACPATPAPMSPRCIPLAPFVSHVSIAMAAIPPQRYHQGQTQRRLNTSKLKIARMCSRRSRARRPLRISAAPVHEMASRKLRICPFRQSGRLTRCCRNLRHSRVSRGEVLKVKTSMMTHGAMLWGAALYNNGSFPLKNARFGESYFVFRRSSRNPHSSGTHSRRNPPERNSSRTDSARALGNIATRERLARF